MSITLSALLDASANGAIQILYYYLLYTKYLPHAGADNDNSIVACSLTSYCHHNFICLSVSPSVQLSVTVCIAAKRYILQQKCLNKWIGTATLKTQFYNFQPPTPTISPETPPAEP